MEVPGFACAQTARCCRDKRIPATLVDLARIAEHLAVPPREVFETHLQPDLSGVEPLLLLRKAANGYCGFNTDDRRCAIHPAKPAACDFYICDDSLTSTDGYPWACVFNNPEGRYSVVAYSIAQEVTQTYLRHNGAAWHDEAYCQALTDTQRRCDAARKQTIKAARRPDGSCALLMFDCPACPYRPTCCKDRPLTLADIRTLATRLGLTIEAFFHKYVATTPADKADGLFSLRRTETSLPRDAASEEGHCVLLDAGSRCCLVKADAPSYCRLMACPVVCADPEMAERYFLGSGSLTEQFHYSLAAAVTCRYVREWGHTCDEHGIQMHLALLDQLAPDPRQLEDFRASICRYRYPREPA